MTLTEDIAIGTKGEKIAEHFIKKSGAVEVYQVAKDIHLFDMIALMPTGELKKIDINMDVASQKTGNIAVEYEKGGTWSGVLTSKAEIIFFVLPNKVLSMPRGKLLGFLAERRFRTFHGDGDKSNFVLLPVAEIEKQDWVTKWLYKLK